MKPLHACAPGSLWHCSPVGWFLDIAQCDGSLETRFDTCRIRLVGDVLDEYVHAFRHELCQSLHHDWEVDLLPREVQFPAVQWPLGTVAFQA